MSVSSASSAGTHLPPISLYKVGDACLWWMVTIAYPLPVRKGKRLLMRRSLRSPAVCLSADLTLEDADTLAATTSSSIETHLDVLRPEQDVRLTMPGDYAGLQGAYQDTSVL